MRSQLVVAIVVKALDGAAFDIAMRHNDPVAFKAAVRAANAA